MPLRMDIDDDRIRVHDDGALLLAYRYRTWQSKPYCETVALPADCGDHAGENLVLVCPHDHAWHFGLWFAQKRIDDINFWEVEALKVEGKRWGQCQHAGLFDVPAPSDGGVALGQCIDWVLDTGEAVLKERRTLTVHPPTDQAYRIDWRLEFTAVQRPRRMHSFGRWGHYSGLCWRPCRQLVGGEFINAQMSYFWNVVAVRSEWCDFTGKLDRSPIFQKPAHAGMTMFDHPANPDFPVRWYAVYEPFAFLAPNRTYNTEVILEPDKPVTWRYGVFVHYNPPDRNRINAEYQRYTQTD